MANPSDTLYLKPNGKRKKWFALTRRAGAAKSLTQTILRSVIDPSTTELRSAPKNNEDVFVGAGVNWLLAYDNVSHSSADLQDTLCRIATGATHATRRLYTNHEEATIRAKRAPFDQWDRGKHHCPGP